jgi:hypothetical protein
LAPVLKYGSGPSSDFLAKMLGVDTPPFPWKTQFHLLLSLLLLHRLMRCCVSALPATVQLVACLLLVQPAQVLFPCRVSLFLLFSSITLYVMVMKDIKFSLFLSLCIYWFIYLFSFFL